MEEWLAKVVVRPPRIEIRRADLPSITKTDHFIRPELEERDGSSSPSSESPPHDVRGRILRILSLPGKTGHIPDLRVEDVYIAGTTRSGRSAVSPTEEPR